MAGVVGVPAPTQPVHASRPPLPPGLVPVAVLVAAAVGLLALLPSLAQAVWEVPHLFLLGLVISYGVFAQRNTDAANAAAAKERGSLAWNARYHPDDSLVVVADHAAPSDDDDARERPLSLPVRRLKPSPAAQESETGDDDDAGDAFGEEETDSCASSSGFWAGARAGPSPPSVLDADLGLSPRSHPESSSSRPLFVHSAIKSHDGSNAATAESAMARGFVTGNVHWVPHDHQQWSDDDGEGTDWDDEETDGLEKMILCSERSVRGDFAAAACAYDDHNEGDTSVDEELFELAAKTGPDGEEEVDRKADEFIAKFREQIRSQRH